MWLNLFYNKLEGSVQNRNIAIVPLPQYMLVVNDCANVDTHEKSVWLKELELLNQQLVNDTVLYVKRFYLTNKDVEIADAEIEKQFADIDSISVRYRAISVSNPKSEKLSRLLLCRAVLHNTLRNYNSALNDLNTALSLQPDGELLLLARAYIRTMLMKQSSSKEDNPDAMFEFARQQELMEAALCDLDKLTELNPEMAYAWYNKGCVYFDADNLSSALSCFSQAIELQPGFGAFYFNRALTYLRLGNRQSAQKDLSKAGELGVLQAYNLMKHFN